MRFIVCFTFYTQVLKSLQIFQLTLRGMEILYKNVLLKVAALPKIKITEIKKENYELKNAL